MMADADAFVVGGRTGCGMTVSQIGDAVLQMLNEPARLWIGQ